MSADITMTVEHDGTVLLNAAEVVQWLKDRAQGFGDGERGGTPTLRRGAMLALNEVAESLEGAYIDAAADEVLENWRPMP